MSVIKTGSQFSYGNIFNSEIESVESYDALINDVGQKDIQFILNNDEVMMKMINVTSIIEGFVDFTNLLCTIE